MEILLNICACGFVLAPIIMIIIINISDHEFVRRHFVWYAGAGAVWQLCSAAAGFATLILSGRTKYNFSVLWDIQVNHSAYFSIDPVRLFLLFVIGLVAIVSVLIANRTIDRNRSSYTNLLMILILGMNGMLLVNDMFSLYVFMEVTGISCFVMIAMFRTKADMEGSFKYLVMSELASVFILTGLSFIFMRTGSLEYDIVDELAATIQNGGRENALIYVAIVLLMSGFAVKSGAVPFHSWLPDAHQSADTAVSVLLSSIVIKIAGIYGLVVVVKIFGALAPVRACLAFMGIITIAVGALLAARQSHFKRVIAYSSVSQMGYIILGISTNTKLGLVGAMAHVLSHAMFKSTLFANAAALHEQTGTLDMNEMGGLENQMPKTAFSSVIAFLSTAGIPPLAGFWSKTIILLALWKSGHQVLASAALLLSIFTSAYFIRMQKKVFFGAVKEKLDDVKEITGTILTSEIGLTVLTIGVGLIYPLILICLDRCGIL